LVIDFVEQFLGNSGLVMMRHSGIMAQSLSSQVRDAGILLKTEQQQATFIIDNSAAPLL
jgi:hypothetical protein